MLITYKIVLERLKNLFLYVFFFIGDGINGIIREKDYKYVNMMLPYIASFMNRNTGSCNQPSPSTVHVEYSNLLWNLFVGEDRAKVVDEYCTEVESWVEVLKVSAKQLLEYLENETVLILKFHALIHVLADVKPFGNIYSVDELLNNHFIRSIRTFIPSFSGRPALP